MEYDNINSLPEADVELTEDLDIKDTYLCIGNSNTYKLNLTDINNLPIHNKYKVDSVIDKVEKSITNKMQDVGMIGQIYRKNENGELELNNLKLDEISDKLNKYSSTEIGVRYNMGFDGLMRTAAGKRVLKQGNNIYYEGIDAEAEGYEMGISKMSTDGTEILPGECLATRAYPWNEMKKVQISMDDKEFNYDMEVDNDGNYFTEVPLYYIKEKFILEKETAVTGFDGKSAVKYEPIYDLTSTWNGMNNPINLLPDYLSAKGINIFNPTEYKNPSYSWLTLANDTNGFTISGYQNIATTIDIGHGRYLPKTQYTISFDYDFTVIQQDNMSVTFNYTDGTYTTNYPSGTSYNWTGHYSGHKKYTSTAGKTVKSITTGHHWNRGDSVWIFSNVKLELGTMETEFSTYDVNKVKLHNDLLSNSIGHYTWVSKYPFKDYRPAEFFVSKLKADPVIDDGSFDDTYDRYVKINVNGRSLYQKYKNYVDSGLAGNEDPILYCMDPNSSNYQDILDSKHYFGCYEVSTDSYNNKNVLVTKPNKVPATNISLDEARLQANNIGSSYHCIDIKSLTDFYYTLSDIEYKTLNSQSKIMGNVNSATFKNTGDTDILKYRTADLTTSSDDTKAFKWNWIENVYGNLFKMLDGIMVKTELVSSTKINRLYVSEISLIDSNMSQMTGYKQISIYSNATTGYSTIFGYDINYPWAQCPVKIATSSIYSDYRHSDTSTNYNIIKNYLVSGYFGSNLLAGLHYTNVERNLGYKSPNITTFLERQEG